MSACLYLLLTVTVTPLVMLGCWQMKRVLQELSGETDWSRITDQMPTRDRDPDQGPVPTTDERDCPH